MPMEVYTAFASGVPTERVQISERFSTNQSNLEIKLPNAVAGTPCTTEVAAAGPPAVTSGTTQSG